MCRLGASNELSMAGGIVRLTVWFLLGVVVSAFATAEDLTEVKLKFEGAQDFYTIKAKSFPRLISITAATRQVHAIAIGMIPERNEKPVQPAFQLQKKNLIKMVPLFLPANQSLKLVYALDRKGELLLSIEETQLPKLEAPDGFSQGDQGVVELKDKKTSFSWQTDDGAWYTVCAAQFPGDAYSMQIKGARKWDTYKSDSRGRICIPNLSPGEGKFKLIFSPARGATSAGQAYLSLQEQAPPPDGIMLEKESEDTAWEISNVARGVLHGASDVDNFLLTADETLSDQGLQIIATPEESFIKYTLEITHLESRRKIYSLAGYGPLETETLRLPEGKYSVSLRGAGDRLSYDLKAQLTETNSNANSEVEPNDIEQLASGLPGQTLVKGELRNTEDIDIFKFDTTSEKLAQRWLVQITGEGIASLQLNKHKVKKAADQSSLRIQGMYLLPGLHYLTVRGSGKYTIFTRPLGPLVPGIEREPNDPRNGVAQVLSFEQSVRGTFDGNQDIDNYRFNLPKQQDVLLNITAPLDTAVKTELYWANERLKRIQVEAGGNLEKKIKLEAGDYSLQIKNNKSSQDEYSLGIQIDSTLENKIPGITDMKLTLANTRIRSLSRFGQKVKGTFRAKSLTDKDIELSLYSSTRSIKSDLPHKIKLHKGSVLNKEFSVEFPPDIPVGNGVITLETKSADGRSTTLVEYDAAESFDLQAPFIWFAVPSQLRGALDVAQMALGASIKGHSEGTAPYQIINGISPYWRPFKLRNKDFSNGIEVVLDRPYQIHGFYFNTTTSEYNSRRLRSYEVYYATDTEAWELAGKGSLTAANFNQYVTLNEPVKAHRILLKPVSNFNPEKADKIATLQEFGVLAFPEESLDLGSRARGAHIVYNTFYRNYNLDLQQQLLDGPSDKLRARCSVPKGEKGASWVVGLHNNRAARIDSVQYLLAEDPEKRLPVPTLSYSVSGPFGPWQEVAKPAVTEAVVNWQIKNQPYMRYLKFHSEAKPRRFYSCAMGLQINEIVGNAQYKSILGEWGGFSENGPYEFYEQKALILEYPPFGGKTRDAAVFLKSETIKSSVKLERNEDWYTFTAPENLNAFITEVEKPAYTRLSVDLYKDGSTEPEKVLSEVQETSSRLGHHWNSQNTVWSVEAGKRYYIKIAEASRNIVATWDQSGSVSRSRDYIDSALHEWSHRLEEGKEVVQLFPFVEKPLTDGWAGYPFLVQAALAKPTKSASSDGSKALVQANNLLDGVSGARSIIVTTDADGPANRELWPLLRKVCPRIFVGGLSASASADGVKEKTLTDTMQDWAGVCGGEYHDINGFEQLESLFRIAAARLRSPKSYHFRGTFEKREPPKPGRIKVEFDSRKAQSLLPHLSLVLDTSGSMLQRIGKLRRIEVAKRAVSALVKELPQSTGINLFTFGDTPDSCSVIKRYSSKGKQRSGLARTISSLKAVNKVKTPLAAALLKLETQTSADDNDRTIVLITDGEETCGGDPAAAIARLRSGGISVKIEIVGFAIGDDNLKNTFKEWAKLGAGRYWDAQNEKELTNHLMAAVSPKIVINDSAGRVVFEGVYEKPVVLQPGAYTVHFGKGEKSVSKTVQVFSKKDSAVKF